MKYFTKRLKVDAKQFTADPVVQFEIEKWCNGSIKGLALEASERVIDIYHQEVDARGKVGDWVVIDSNGAIHFMSEDTFNATYEPALSSNGIRAMEFTADPDEQNAVAAWCQGKIRYHLANPADREICFQIGANTKVAKVGSWIVNDDQLGFRILSKSDIDRRLYSNYTQESPTLTNAIMCAEVPTDKAEQLKIADWCKGVVRYGQDGNLANHHNREIRLLDNNGRMQAAKVSDWIVKDSKIGFHVMSKEAFALAQQQKTNLLNDTSEVKIMQVIADPVELEKIAQWCTGVLKYDLKHLSDLSYCTIQFLTYEGRKSANVGDWIVKQDNGQFYTCGPYGLSDSQPQITIDRANKNSVPLNVHADTISLRDEFAMESINHAFNDITDNAPFSRIAECAKYAYVIADAMMKAREV